MNNRLFCTGNRLVGSLDQVISSLSQNLDGHVIWNQLLLNQLAHKIKVGLARRWKPNLNLFVTHGYKQVEHLELALWAHWVN